jgi:hypothetical protein
MSGAPAGSSACERSSRTTSRRQRQSGVELAVVPAGQPCAGKIAGFRRKRPRRPGLIDAPAGSTTPWAPSSQPLARHASQELLGIRRVEQASRPPGWLRAAGGACTIRRSSTLSPFPQKSSVRVLAKCTSPERHDPAVRPEPAQDFS